MPESKINENVALLKECDAGTKMAVYAFDHVMDSVHSDGLKRLLTDSKEEHERLGNELHRNLSACHAEEGEPPAMGRIGAWVSTEMKLMVNDSDQKIAKIISEGCHMGINSLSHYMNEYKDAEKESFDLCTKLIKMEQKLMDSLRMYL